MISRLIALALCTVGLTACEANMADYDYAARYPITVETRTALLILEPGPGGRVKPMDSAAIDEFAHDYANRSAGGITVQVGANAVNDPLATGFATEIAQILASRGIPSNAIQMTYATDEESAKHGRAVMQFPIYVAIANECGTFKDQPGFTPLNENTYGFGCANQRNLAAMVVNPRDLIDAQPSSGRLAARSSVIVGKYIVGSKIGASVDSQPITTPTTTGGL